MPAHFVFLWQKGAQGIKSAKYGKNRSMIKPTQNIQQIKEEIKNFYDKEVDVRVNLGRNKIVNFSGKLSGVYPALFTVRPDDENFLGKTAYSYAEVLCGSIDVRPAPKKN